MERDEKSVKKAQARIPTSLSKVVTETKRLTTGMEEFDRVIGGGIVSGNLMVLTGEPGIGKSTLSLQIADALASKIKKILYISGEESIEQISLRAHRLNFNPENLSLLNETEIEVIMETLKQEKPNFVIIDSIQVLSSKNFPSQAGSIQQVRYATEMFLEWGKKNGVPIMLIGHVTKEGNLAGPRVFEHLVDTVLFLEGNRYHQFRVLRTLKNRFGSTNELGVFEMNEKGLMEVKNASESFLTGRKEGAFGSIVTCTIEGSRPFLVEVQALTSLSLFGYPKRTASGFDVNRLQLLIAVLQNHAKLNFSNQDVYINVIGGLELKEPAADLAILLALASSLKKIPLPSELVAFGEVGLAGELRSVTDVEKRIKESEKLGFKKIITGKIANHYKIETTQVKDIVEALKQLWSK